MGIYTAGGGNKYGKVGNGSKEDQDTPVKVLEGVKEVSLGWYHSAAVMENGDLYCWGNNNGHGAVGNGSRKDQYTPVKVLEGVKEVSLRAWHSAAVTENGDLYCWGWNEDGEVGNGSTEENQDTPVKVLEGVTEVSLGYGHSAAITENGDLYCWGDNGWRQVGNGSTEDQHTPVKVLEGVTEVSLGNEHSAAITENGDLYCWGNNRYGQVGNGSRENQDTPVKVLEGVTEVSLGYGHSAAVTENGDLYCWGWNEDGEVGNGSRKNQHTPVKVLEGVKEVSLGDEHSAAVTENGDLYCWGRNEDGQVGNGSRENQDMPVKVLEGVTEVSLSLGGDHSAAVTENGDLYCWGYNGRGQVGNGSTENQLTPVKVLGSGMMPEFGSSAKPTASAGNLGLYVDRSNITISAYDYDSIFASIEGAKVDIEETGEAVTDENGKAHIANSLSEPSAMKRITVTKEGYRDYIFYTTILAPELVSIFASNEYSVSLKRKKEGDDSNPYLSTVMWYSDEIAKQCGGQFFERSDVVTFRACGVWNDKKAGHYCMYQNGPGGKTIESEDGIFRINIGKDFSGRGDIYVKMIAEDGTESEPELLYIRVPEGSASDVDDSYVPILNEGGESPWQTEVPFLNNDKLSFDLGKIKTTIKREGSKIRIMLGAEGKKDLFQDEEWEKWKKFCESQPTDLSLSQWNNVLSSDNMTTSWTGKAKIAATGYGWLESDLSDGNQNPALGGIQILLDASTEFKEQYIVGIVPVYLEQSIGAKLELDGKITYDINARKFGGDTDMSITPSLKVGGGVGVLYVATVGVEGSASMPVKLKFPLRITQADLVGSLSLKASVLGFNYSKEMAKTTYPLYKEAETKSFQQDRKGNAPSENASMYDMDQYTLPEKRDLETKWYGDRINRLKKASASETGLKETLMQTGTSELTEPILVQQGDTALAVFLTEDSGREVIHRTKLVYSVYHADSGTWSEPRAVDEDGTGDFKPSLTENNGKIAVAWLNYSDRVDDSSSMQEALQESGVCCAVWDEKEERFIKESSVLSASSSVSYNGAHPYVDEAGNITLVGIKNTDTDIFGMSGDNVLFMKGIGSESKTDKEFALSQGIPVSYDVAAADHVLTAAVCIDTDRNLATLDDREIYLFPSEGDVKRLTENTTYDSAPQYAKYQGEDTLFWYTENGIRIKKGSGAQELLIDRETAAVSENFTVVNGAGDQTAVVWSGVDKNGVYQLTSCLYDEAEEKWSSQVVLSDSTENIFRPSGYFNENGDMEFIYRKGSTIAAGELYALQVPQAPDLEIVDAYLADGTEVPGKKTTVYVGVRNLGTKEITQCHITVDGQQTSVETSVAPGEKAILEAEYTVPDAVESREISVEAKVDGDRDMTNNDFAFSAGYTDISLFAEENVQSNGKTVHVTVGNEEAVAANAVLEIHKNTKDGELLSTVELGELKQGDLVSVDFAYPKGEAGYDVDAAALYYVVRSDAVEKYESNNYDYAVFSEAAGDSSGDISATDDPAGSQTTQPGVTAEPPSSAAPSSPDSTAAVTPTGSQQPLPGSTAAVTPTGSQRPLPGSTAIPAPSVRPAASQTPLPKASADVSKNKGKTGTAVTVKGLRYKITKVKKDGTGEVTLTGPAGKKQKKKIAALKTGNAVTIQGKAFRVTQIKAAAFQGCKRLKSVTLGKHIKRIGDSAFRGCTALTGIAIPAKTVKIGKRAFYGCKKLKNVTIKTTALTAKNVGGKAFQGIYPKAVFRVPKAKKKAYKKLLRAKGAGKKATIRN